MVIDTFFVAFYFIAQTEKVNKCYVVRLMKGLSVQKLLSVDICADNKLKYTIFIKELVLDTCLLEILGMSL